jgi:microcystin-dependent protein
LPLETATYFPDLNVANPAHSDGLSQADSHMRLIKSALKATFPNFTSAALSSTQAQIDAVAALLVSGVLRGNGAVPAGMVNDFAGTAAPTGWLECDGSSVLRSTYPDLFTAIGTTWGAADGTHFNLPPDRYRRGRTAAAAAVGTLQASQNLSHTHTNTVGNQSADHAHAQQGSFVSSVSNQSLSHTHSGGQASTQSSFGGTNSGSQVSWSGSPSSTGAVDLTGHNHTVTISGSTGGISASHNHLVTIDASGSAEARPLTAVYLTCIKT